LERLNLGVIFGEVTQTNVPIFQAAPLDRMGSVKGGPFSEGCYSFTGTWTEQYGIMDIYRNEENQTCLTITGYRTFMESPGWDQVLVEWSTCTPTVKKGVPGMGTCSAQIIPLNYWLLLGLSYGIGFLLLLISIFLHRQSNAKRSMGRRDSVRRAIGIIVFALLLVLSIVVIPIALAIWPMGNYVYRPAFLPVDIGWVAVGLDGLFLVWLGVEFIYFKAKREDEEFYLSLR